MKIIIKRASSIAYLSVIVLLMIISGISCEDYLDLKQDKKLVIPKTLDDCQVLLDYYSVMNVACISWGAMACDNYFVEYSRWNTDRIERRDAYVWKEDGDVTAGQWSAGYKAINYANTVLKTLADVEIANKADKEKKEELKGMALFYRAYMFYDLVQHFAMPYNETEADNTLGIPLLLSPDISQNFERATLKQTYDRIIMDLEEAVNLLPLQKESNVKTHPCKEAALGLLARVYLNMENYTEAGNYANACLESYDLLIDFSSLNAASSSPFPKYPDNIEVIYMAEGSSLYLATPLRGAMIDTLLYESYNDDDLRKTVLFEEYSSKPGYYIFKGGYAYYSNRLFRGITTDEMYLIRAECSARNGELQDALDDLNTLLETRWADGLFTPFTASSAENALALILKERRKELIYRGERWADLRRLNKDPRFAVTIKRKLDGTVYELSPGDLRYTFLIPFDEIERSGMVQNKR